MRQQHGADGDKAANRLQHPLIDGNRRGVIISDTSNYHNQARLIRNRNAARAHDSDLPWRLTRRGRLTATVGVLSLLAATGGAWLAGVRPGPVAHWAGVETHFIQPDKSPPVCDVMVTNQHPNAWSLGSEIVGSQGDPRNFISDASATKGNGDLAKLQPDQLIYIGEAMCKEAVKHNVPVDYIS